MIVVSAASACRVAEVGKRRTIGKGRFVAARQFGKRLGGSGRQR